MLPILSRTAQACGVRQCRACLSTGPRRAIVRRRITKKKPVAVHSSCTLFKAPGPLPATNRRVNRARASLPCAVSHTDDDDAPWTMTESRDGIAKVLWSLRSLQQDLIDHQNNMASRKKHLDVTFHKFGLGSWWDTEPVQRAKAEKEVAYVEKLELASRAEEADRARQYRNPTTDIFFRNFTSIIKRLVRTLMWAAACQRFGQNREARHRAMESLEGPWKTLDMLRSDGYPKYTPYLADPVAAGEGLNKSNETLRALFDKWQNAKLYEDSLVDHWTRTLPPGSIRPHLVTTMIFKICFSLLAQRYQPDIHTYNVLLAGLSSLREHRLAGIVLASLETESRLYPTGVTILLQLQHYYASDDILRFYRQIRKMIGKDTTGVYRRRVHWATDPKRAKAYLGWANSHDVSNYAGYWLERSWLDDKELDAIIRGLIHFGQSQHAAQVLTLALKLGYSMDTTLLTELLSVIVSRVDHGAAVLLVRGLCANISDVLDLIYDRGCPKEVLYKLGIVMEFYAARLASSLGTIPAAWRPDLKGESDRQKRQRYRRLADSLKSDLPARELGPPGLSHLATALWIRNTEGFLGRLKPIVTLARQLAQTDLNLLSRKESSRPQLQVTKVIAYFERLSAWDGGRTARRPVWRNLCTYHMVYERIADLSFALRSFGPRTRGELEGILAEAKAVLAVRHTTIDNAASQISMYHRLHRVLFWATRSAASLADRPAGIRLAAELSIAASEALVQAVTSRIRWRRKRLRYHISQQGRIFRRWGDFAWFEVPGRR